MWVLHSIRSSSTPNRAEALYVTPLDGDAGDTRELGVIARDEDTTTGRFGISADGVVVGTVVTDETIGPIVLTMPGSPADRPDGPTTRRDLGLPAPSAACARCTTAFAIQGDGDTVGWLEGERLVTDVRLCVDPAPNQTLPPDIRPCRRYRADVGVRAVGGYIDVLPDNSVLIIPDPARPGSDAPRRIDADGSPLEVYEGAISVTEGPSM